MNDFDHPRAPKRINIVNNQQQINNTRIEIILQHIETQRKQRSEHPFIYHFWLRLGDGIIIPLPTLSRPGKELQQKEKKQSHISADCIPAPFCKVHENARDFV
jgi:hypothetical protein